MAPKRKRGSQKGISDSQSMSILHLLTVYLPEKVAPRITRGLLDARTTFDNLYNALNCMYIPTSGLKVPY